MKTIEIFAEAVKFASEASDIPSDRILSESRDADVVDARMLIIKTRKKNSRHAIDLYRIVPRRERAADIERFVRCFGISANDINKPKQVCDNPS